MLRGMANTDGEHMVNAAPSLSPESCWSPLAESVAKSQILRIASFSLEPEKQPETVHRRKLRAIAYPCTHSLPSRAATEDSNAPDEGSVLLRTLNLVACRRQVTRNFHAQLVPALDSKDDDIVQEALEVTCRPRARDNCVEGSVVHRGCYTLLDRSH